MTGTDGAARRVAVVYGGRSSEHAVSCVSAGSVLAALAPSDWDVVPVGITRDGRWVHGTADPQQLRIVGDTLPEVDPAAPPFDPTALGEFDVVFPLLHGPYGEDGTIQGLLELADVRYVGSGVLASAAAMDKAVMKLLLAGAGLPVGPYVLVGPRDRQDGYRAAAARVAAELELPVFVKPARGGSSLGISKVTDLADLTDAIRTAAEHDPKVVVEQGLEGREIECGVLDRPGGPPHASLPAEIRVHPDHDFYDFTAKYLGGADLDVPAKLTDTEIARVQDLAVQAFEAMGCEGLGRVDFFLGVDGTLVVNEVNTMPGFTPSSMFPKMWAATGLDYPELVDTLLRAALSRPLGLR